MAGSRLSIAALFAVPIVVVADVANPMTAVLLIGMGTAAHQAFSSNIFTMISDLYPRRAVATVAGIGGAAGAVGGMLIAQVTGWTLELTGSYTPIVIHALVPRMEPAAMPAD